MSQLTGGPPEREEWVEPASVPLQRASHRLPTMGEVEALDAIAALLSGNVWNVGDLEAVAAIIRETGREVSDVAEVDDAEAFLGVPGPSIDDENGASEVGPSVDELRALGEDEAGLDSLENDRP